MKRMMLSMGMAITLAGCAHAPSPLAAAEPALPMAPVVSAVPIQSDGAPPPWVNSLGMPFVRVPAGVFQMGGLPPVDVMAAIYPQLERKRLTDLTDEIPAHEVRISRTFYLGQHEVTVGQFRRFIELSGYQPESEADGTGGYGYNAHYDPATTERGDAFEGRDPRYSWRNPGFEQGSDHPVVNVTWNDAQALARWLTRTEGHTYRLPTEAEWEYACRAGTRTLYPHGDDPKGLVNVANTFDQAAAPLWPLWHQQVLPGNDGHAFTAPVGSYAPNALGLYDMLGNAWEWVSDWHDDNYYAQSPHDDPQGPAAGSVRVRRGGSWHTWSLYARCGFRNWNTPQTRYTLVGMRLVRDIESPPQATQRP